MTDLAGPVERGDLDELTRLVDHLAFDEDWEGLVELRDRCRKALERGKQLWPVAANVEYRLALEAPGPWAASVVGSTVAHFVLGPLAEVAASTHTWRELAPHLSSGPAAGIAAHERVVRGEHLSDDADASALPPVLELPLSLQPWEPEYALAEYHEDRAEFPMPEVVTAFRTVAAEPGTRVDDPEAIRALVELAQVWTTESNGRAEAVAIEGDATAAVASTGLSRFRIAEITPSEAVALMAWTAASGGAHGRRRGAAVGRYAAWWAVAAIDGLLDEWPVPPEWIGEAAQSLRWFVWDAGEPDTGWVLRLAAEDPESGLAWAVAATDSA